MITATKLRQVNPSANGNQYLWHLSEPVGYGYDWEKDTTKSVTEYVITSAAVVFGSGPETYIFPADADGNVIDWGEMSGSIRGYLNHEMAIREAGWAVAL